MLKSRRRTSPVVVEALEPRALLAVVLPFEVRLYRDLNMNGRRDVGEGALQGWTVGGQMHDEAGAGYDAIATTNADGIARLTDCAPDDFFSHTAIARIARSRGYWCTSIAPSTGDEWTVDATWFSGDNAKKRVDVGLSDRVIVTGKVNNRFSLASDEPGAAHVTRLALRRVYDDVNDNGRFDDATDPSTLTDLEGNYRLKLKAGDHNLRVELSDEWKSVTSKGTSNSLSLTFTEDARSVRGPDFNATLRDPAVIDLAIGYTSAAADGRDADEMRDLVRDLVADANRPYANSDTNVKLDLVAAQETSYHESGKIDRDLDRLQDDNDGYADDVSELREASDADLAILLSSSDRTDGGLIGLAYEFAGSKGNSNLGFAVIALQQDADEDSITLAHEVGHTLGANHDSANTDGDVIEAYAHGYAFVGTDGSRYQDVMSYGNGQVLPFFSSPNYAWAGKPIGRKDVADNSRIIEELGSVVAEYR